jgi:type IV pilus assembly protein PilM
MFERTILGLDIGSYSAKMAVLRAGLRAVECTAFEQLVFPREAPSEELEATLQLFLQNQDLPLEYVVTALDTDCLTQRHLRFPFSGAKRVTQAIDFEIDEAIPLPLEGTLRVHEQVLVHPERTDALVLIAPEDRVREHLDATRRMELEPRIVEAEGAVLANLSTYLGLADTSRLLLDIGHEKTHLCLLVDGKPLAVRRIEIAGHHLTEILARDLGLSYDAAEEHKHERGVFEAGSTKPLTAGVGAVLDGLVREILRSVDALVGDPIDPIAPAGIVLLGGTARLSGLDAFLEERTGWPTSVLAVSRSNEGAGLFARSGAPVFAQAAALALRASNTDRVTQMDFRQGALEHRADLTALRPQLQLTLALFGVTMALWLVSAIADTWSAESRAAGLRDRIAALYEQTFPSAVRPGDPLANLQAQAREARDLAEHLGVTGRGITALEVLRELSERVPPTLDVRFDDIRIERRSIVAQGRTGDFVTADRLKQQLLAFDGFHDVEIADVTSDPRGGGKTFTLRIRLGEEQ